MKRAVSWTSVCLVVAGCASAQPAGDAALTLFDGRPHAGLRVLIASADGQQEMKDGRADVAPKPPATKSRALVRASAKDRAGDALTMHWEDTRSASLRIAADKPLDLRAYLPDGAIEFDIDVQDMAKAGLTFAMECRPDCGRKVPWFLPSRALQGQGWTHLSIPLHCFDRGGDDFGAVTQPFVVQSGIAGQVAFANVRIVPHRQSGSPRELACTDYALASVTPEPQTEVWALQWWLPRHEEKLQEVRALLARGIQPQIVFVGDSITHNWDGAGRPVWDEYYRQYDALQLGFGGDRTENVLWRLQHGEVDGLAPRVVVLLIGTNNTGQRREDPATTAAGIARVVDELRQRMPDAKVLLLAVFPRDEHPGTLLRTTNEQVNARIAGLDDGRHVFFLDIGKDLTAPDGTLSKTVMPDFLHPNEAGYRLWARSMQPTLQKLLGP